MITNKKTLPFQILTGFFVVVTILIVFLYYLSLYAMDLVRTQVAQSESKLLSMHVKQIDKTLEGTKFYLLRLTSQDTTNSDLVSLNLYASGDNDYFFAKQRILWGFKSSLDSFNIVHTFFAYSARNQDLIKESAAGADTSESDDLLFKQLRAGQIRANETWQVMQGRSAMYLVRMQRVRNVSRDVFVGAVIRADRIMLSDADLPERKAVLSYENRIALSSYAMTPGQIRQLHKLQAAPGALYRSYRDEEENKRYVLVDAAFNEAPVTLHELIPEGRLLQQLPNFQQFILTIPAIGLIILAVYWLFLRNVLVRPMTELIGGMRRMMRGDFDVRLTGGSTREFAFLNETFNHLVAQVHDLRIGVYEERLKKQDAEFKHLQAQINPHFYLNSLNIIYSLAGLGRGELVQKMAEHLAEYFRFITRSHREMIFVAEELGHIRNYLEIQQLRFPRKMTYSIECSPDVENRLMLPLTIQPFVENAMVHGMEQGKTVFHIAVTVNPVKTHPHVIEAVVADNGRGIPEDVLERLDAGGLSDGTGSRHLGIWNVASRLRRKYGGRAGLHIGNGDKGALVRITFPAFSEQDMEEDESDDERIDR